VSQIAVADLTKDQADAELAWLADELAAHDLRYHQQDAPTISDAEYDALKRRNLDIEARFPELIRENSPSCASAPRGPSSSRPSSTACRC
jgi:DNA ligase (NAD+)